VNALTTVNAPPLIQMPSDAMQAMVLAEKLATARLVPPAFQKSPADIFMVMAFCQRFQLDFFMTIQEVSVIRNRLFCSGKLTAAMLNSSGALAERLSYEYSGEGDNRSVKVSARLASETEPRSIEVSLKDARTENENWRKQPDQQLSYAGSRIWGRRHAPEILLGLMFEGEVIDVTPSVVQHGAPANDNQKAAANDNVEQRSEIMPPPPAQKATPHTIPLVDEDWRRWAQQMIAFVRAEQDLDAIAAWVELNDQHLRTMSDTQPKMHQMLDLAIDAHRNSLDTEAS
jgi:hypothetical protein